MMSQAQTKILFVDMESPLGHADVNYFFIKYVLTHFNNCYYMLDSDLHKKMVGQYSFAEFLPVIYFPFQKKKSASYLSNRLLFFKKLRFIFDFLRRNDIKGVVFLSYDTLSISCFSKKLSVYKVILMNHDNIARFIRTPLRKLILKRLKDYIHLVYCEADDSSQTIRLLQNLEFNNILQIEHHIDESRKISYKMGYNAESVALYAPSNGNDDNKIISLLNSLKGNNITVKAKVIESVYHRYLDRYEENLFFGFITDDVFEKEMNSADFILLLYPDDYTFRTSGMLFDAIAYEKPVITDNRFLFESYLEKYGLGIFVDAAIAVEKAISQIDQTIYKRFVSNLRNYKRTYSAEKIGSVFASKIQQIMES